MLIFKGLSLVPGSRDRMFKKAQDIVDEEVIKRLEDYTPVAMPGFRNRGKMSRSHSAQSPGIVINTEPKARREYYTNKGFSGGRRGAFWLDRMKADQKKDIIKSVMENL